MRTNKTDRNIKNKCNFIKCCNKGITGIYFRDGKIWCSRTCWKKQKEINFEKEKGGLE